MSIRIPVLLILTLLLVGLSGTAAAQFKDLGVQDPWPSVRLGDPPVDADDDGDDSGLGFGKKIAGTWAGSGSFALDLDCDGVADEGAEPTYFDLDTQSFTIGGLYLVTTSTNPYTAHGAWEKTGPRQITTNNVTFLHDPDGVLLFLMRIPGVFDFDADFATATSTFGAIGYLPTQDPLDPAEIPVWCTAGQHDLLRKLDATP